MLKNILKLFRVAQWTKNLLVFLPVIASHSWSHVQNIQLATITFFAMCCSSSIGYIINDVLDRTFDLSHPKKKYRPIASGAISLKFAAVLAIGLAFLGGLAMAFLPAKVDLMIALYLSTSIFYSFKLKGFLLLDLFCLASLFTFRIVIGGEAISVSLSVWLLSFSCFLFWSLAAQKRVAELVTKGGGIHSGREYRDGEEFVLSTAGISSAASAILLSVFYIFSQAPELYRNPHFLYGISLIIGYWLVRSWILVFRKELDDDPISFFIKDSATFFCLSLSIILFYLAL